MKRRAFQHGPDASNFESEYPQDNGENVCLVNFNNTGNADGEPAGANDTSNFMNENNSAKMTKYYDGI